MHSINKLLERGDTVTSLLLHVAIEYIVLQNYVKMFNKKKHVTAANNNKCHRYFIIPTPNDSPDNMHSINKLLESSDLPGPAWPESPGFGLA